MSISAIIWWVFTPEKLTPVVNKEINRLIVGSANIERVELTFFSTFPEFSLKMDQVLITNPVEGALTDTLFFAESVIANILLPPLWSSNQLIFKGISADDALIYTVVTNDGIANYDLFIPEDEPDTTDFYLPFEFMELQKVILRNSTVLYHYHPAEVFVDLHGLDASLTGMMSGDLLKSSLKAEAQTITVVYDSIAYLQSVPLKLNSSMRFGLNDFKFDFTKADLVINGFPFLVDAVIQIQEEIMTDIKFRSEKLPLAPVLEMVPDYYADMLEGMSMDGTVIANGTLKGLISDTELPYFLMDLSIENGTYAYEGIPVKLSDIDGNATIDLNMNKEDEWNIRIIDFSANSGKSVIRGKGVVDQLLGDMRYQLDMTGDLHLADAAGFMPDDMPLLLKGKALGSMQLKFLHSEMVDFQFDRMQLSGKFVVSDLYALYDTIEVNAPKSTLQFQLPKVSARSSSFVGVELRSDFLQIVQGDALQAGLRDVELSVSTSNLTDSLAALKFVYDIKGKSITARMDEQEIEAGYIHLIGSVSEDKSQSAPLLRWNPSGYVVIRSGRLVDKANDLELRMPMLEVDYSPDLFFVTRSQILLDNSDFELTGRLSNLNAYIKKEGLLEGDFLFRSKITDVNQLMGLFSGMGYDQVDPTDATSPITQNKPSTGPFLVPKGIDVRLDVEVDQTILPGDIANNLTGSLIVKDGIMVFESIMFTASAARMQLTAMYRTPRTNHLFLGLDFHLMDVEIEELLSMIPDVDSIMPMLRSFAGKAEFHFAAETYLDSTYNIKMSTLRGVSSVRGEDLVLMDGETFSEIAKNLRFDKKTENRVDSLSAEFTIFRNEVDIYPFLIVMDRYKAVVSGKHNLDMSFNYHISITDSPLPVKLGVDVSGTIDDLKVRPAPVRYANLYRPARRREIDRRQLEIRQMIRNALLENVKE